jgi:hypothetical protein
VSNYLGANVAAEVSRAEQDYQNVRSRALSLVGVSGGLVALVSGLLAIAAGSAKPVLPPNSRWTIGAALLAFVLSTICALCDQSAWGSYGERCPSLRDLVNKDWDDTGWDRQVASILVDYLESLRKDNEGNANWLIASIAFQILGIALTAVMAILILTNLH